MDVAVASEIRNWVTFGFAVLGGFIALRSYIGSQKQRRLENSFRMIDLFRETLLPRDLERWENIFHASSEPAGATHGHFVVGNERHQVPFSELFMEGPHDEGAIERMAEVFDLISREALDGTVDLRIIYFQLGQLMDTTYRWLETIGDDIGGQSFLSQYYPNYRALYRSGKLKGKWSSRTYAHVG